MANMAALFVGVKITCRRWIGMLDDVGMFVSGTDTRT